MPQPGRSGESLVGHIIAGVILALIFWGGGYLFGDLLFSWATGLAQAGFALEHGSGLLGGLVSLAVAIGVAIVALPLVLIAGAIHYGTKFYVIAIVGFMLGFSPGLGGSIAALVRRFLGVVGRVLTMPFGAAWNLSQARTWRARLIDVGTIALFLVLAAISLVAVRRALNAPPRPPDRILEERPATITPEWRAADSPNVRAYVQLVSITPERMAVTLRFENRGGVRTIFVLGNKLVASGGRGGGALDQAAFVSQTGDHRVPMCSNAGRLLFPVQDIVSIPPHGFLEGTYYFPHPPNPRCFWEVELRWAESTARSANYIPGWVLYAASVSFDLRRNTFFPVDRRSIRQADAVPGQPRTLGAIRW